LFWLNYSTSLLSVFGCTPEAAQALSSQVEQKIQQVFHPEDWVPPEVPATLGLLKEAGFKLAVLSNRTTPCHEYLGTLGLQGFFDFIVVAGEVSSWKPDPHIFRHTLQRLDVLPAQAMYVGDNYYADVVGAQGVGMRPVLIDPERIFLEPGCAVIDGLAQLPNVLA
jgi:putative hydrolase of the HAD superfamily